MHPEELKRRTKEFAKRIIFLCRSLPATREARLIGDQLFRAGTSVGANYRAACRARSPAEFIAKLGIVLEETDECLYWLELIQDMGICKGERLEALVAEANELIAIFVSSLNTARRRKLHAQSAVQSAI
jgi:four helix bundle protein